jgi:hypothetical protein
MIFTTRRKKSKTNQSRRGEKTAKKNSKVPDIRSIRAGSLADFFARSPLRESGLDIPARSPARKVTL